MEAASSGGPEPGAGGYAPGPGSHSGPQSDGLSDNAAGALAYFTIIPAIIFLVIDPFKTRRFVRFHSFQCLFFFAAWFALWVALVVLGGILSVLGAGFVVWMLMPLIWLALFVVLVVTVIKAYQGQEFRLPVIGDLAAKQI
jgi:uncharacterized membrane protein